MLASARSPKPELGAELEAELAHRAPRDEGVDAQPAGAVVGVQAVDVEVAAEVVERHAGRRRALPVDALPVVRVAAEHVVPVVAAPVVVLAPVRVDLELRDVAAPVGDAELAVAGPAAEVRLDARPLLDRPVRAVRHRAGDRQVLQRRAGVAAAGVAERPPVGDLRAPAAGVVELQPQARHVDRAVREHAVHAAARAVRDERDVDALRRAQRLERHAPGVAVDEGRGAGGAATASTRASASSGRRRVRTTIASASQRPRGRHPTAGDPRHSCVKGLLASGRGHRRGRSPLLPARAPARQGAAVPDRGRAAGRAAARPQRGAVRADAVRAAPRSTPPSGSSTATRTRAATRSRRRWPPTTASTPR